MLFQSTLPRRKRRHSFPIYAVILHFNPRFREGSDETPARKIYPIAYFNPRFREGSDEYAQCVFLCTCSFQSTLPRRKRHIFHGIHCFISDFNPRFREGSDESGNQSAKLHKNFNPRFREGSDDNQKLLLDVQADFNPRFREGSDYKHMDNRDL